MGGFLHRSAGDCMAKGGQRKFALGGVRVTASAPL
jgi:hypothetical protein